MTPATLLRAAFATGAVLLVAAGGFRALRPIHPAAAAAPVVRSRAAAAGETLPVAATQGFLYGRITAVDGATYEGRLRFGAHEEAFWSDTFNGYKPRNPWLSQVPPERRPRERDAIRILGITFASWERRSDVVRPLMASFGDIARVEARGREVRVTLKSGSVFVLDRFDASDFDDGVRVWDGRRGIVDLDSQRIRAIEFLPTPALGNAPRRLQGTVRTRQGDFTGFVQWDREECVGTDELRGRTAAGERRLRFGTLRSIARRSRDSARVTLLDGRELELSGGREVGRDNRGIYVDDRRYGRVLVSWDAFERVDFTPGAPEETGPAYADFPPGRPLRGSVTTRAGRRLAGRLVYDLDESETTDTLDAPLQGVSYEIPFGRIASIVPPGREEHGARLAKVTLQSGETLRLESAGDLGRGNAGLLVFGDGGAGRRPPEYVPWSDVRQVDLDRPPAMGPLRARKPGKGSAAGL